MKKTIFVVILLFVVSISFAKNNNSTEATEKKEEKTIVIKIKTYNGETCSVTSSGIIHSAEYGDIPMTLTVTGPCDASLAQIMRDKIAEIRAEFGDTTNQ
jgi:hypothetical protein